MMTTLINTLISEKGELFALGHGRRVLFAKCRPMIKIYEKSCSVPLLGTMQRGAKSIQFVIVLCADMDFTREDISQDGQEVERYELTADIQLCNGIVERFYFHRVELEEINPAGVWEFSVEVTQEQLQKMLG